MPYNITPSKFSMEIVGEKSYQEAIRKIVMYKDVVGEDEMEYKSTNMPAQLIIEDDNKHDPGNAVRVEIDGKPVGYLAKEDAQMYRAQLAKLGIPNNEPCTCIADAFGKRDAPGKVMDFGIWLRMELNRPLEITEVKPRKKFLGLF